MRTSLLTLAATLGAAALAEAQIPIVVPNGAATVEANSSSSYPWNRTTSAIRIQYIYDSTHFTNQGINYPILLYGADWRPNGTTSTYAGTTYNGVDVGVCTAAVDYASASSTFATNRGLDYTLVLNQGSVVYNGFTGTGGPEAWNCNVPFNAPFLYDPSTGDDFLIEVAFAAGSGTSGTATIDVASGATAPAAVGCRVYNLSDPTAATGTVQQDVTAVMQLMHTPASGIFANFDASPTSGASPLNVQFTDTTFTSDPGGVTMWAWDLDGDGNVDSNVQNPMFTYNNCGPYDVTLTATDVQNGSSTETKTGFVFVDPQLVVTADFSSPSPNGLAPHTVNFSDTSSGSPTSWDWDLDGDGNTDSNAQNPSFTYSVSGSYDVTLTASNACFSDTITKVMYVNVVGSGTNQPADVLNYQFNEVRGPSHANVATGNTFPAAGLSGGFAVRDPGRPDFRGNEPGFGCNAYGGGSNDVDAGAPVNQTGSFTIMFWMRRDPASTTTNPFGYAFGDGSFRSFAAGAAGDGITFRGSSIGNVDSGFDIEFTPGVWQHVALVVDDTAGIAEWYSDGFPGGNQTAFTPGTFSYSGSSNFHVGSNNGSSPFSANYDMDDFRWYSTALSPNDIFASSLNEQASESDFDSGCADSNGSTPAFVNGGGAPFVGNAAYTTQVTGCSPGSANAIYLGVFADAGGILPLPLQGTGLFNAGCNFSVSPDVIVNFVADGSGNSPVFPTAVPNDIALVGGHSYGQVISYGGSAVPLGGVSAARDWNVQWQ